MMSPYSSKHHEMVAFSLRMHASGWVSNHEGNISAKTPEGFLCTPTAESKADITEDMLIVVDYAGKVVLGSRKVFSEISLHLAAFRARADIGCVLHAHPPYATAYAISDAAFPDPAIAEFVVSIGAHIPKIPYAMPGSSAFSSNIGEALMAANALLLANHGVLTVGKDIAQAFYRMEMLEHHAKIHAIARTIGNVQPLPEEDARALLEKRRQAGVAPPYDREPTDQPNLKQISDIIEEEVRKVLRR